MLCPRYNPRTDEYGGGLVNRARALVETLAAVRSVVGDNFPVLVKLNGRDGVDNGLQLDESVAVARILENGRADAIEVSGGLLNVANLLDARSDSAKAYFETEAKAFKAAVNLPVILTGGIRSLTTASRLVAEGVADFIAMCRPLICEPGLIARWGAGDTADSRCVDCNRCVESIKQGRGPVCEPVAAAPVQTFFPQQTVLVQGGQGPEPSTCYQVAIGLGQCEAGFEQVIRVQPVEAGQHVGPGIAVPVATGQARAVLQALQGLLKRFGP
jgi:imidazole glycerol phosphate synthase subunit HisF